ncbi:NUDIX domain-containing protein [Oceanobacillus manasiensis]|uniref:NUDIX domain-containing protein n=1 Tax=Oceanobacillus manasiensis TaxID=586413 RepID=UPI0005AA112A|nr:NUDIX hydrolase [Oceanobacillus manasiensis]
MLIPKDIRTSGAYVLYKGLFVFQVGPTKKGSKLGVVRLGGHREDNETALETAKREVYEESQIEMTPFHSNTTFYLSEWNEEPNKVTVNEPIAPILIKGNEKSAYTVMYLSKTSSMPTPSSESKGLLLLSPENVQLICQKRLSLHEYQKLHGISILTPEIDTKLILQPFPQLLFLSRLLKEETELMERFINTSL